MTYKAVILSNQMQRDLWRRDFGGEAALFLIYCDNPSYYEQLKKQEPAAILIDEFTLREEWDTLNSWACAKAVSWGAAAKQQGYFKELDWPSALYLFFSFGLTLMLKNYRLAVKILSDNQLAGIVSFKASEIRSFPNFSGNAYLNYFLAVLAAQKGIPVAALECVEALTHYSEFPEIHSPFKLRLKRIQKAVFQYLYSLFVRLPETADFMILGSLRHLTRIARELGRKGKSLLIYDTEFHKEIYDFAKSEKIHYIIPNCLRDKPAIRPETFARTAVQEITDAVKNVGRGGFFEKDGFDFTSFICNFLILKMEDFFKSLAPQSSYYLALMKKIDFPAVVTEEDYSLRGGYAAALFKQKGKKIFCASHANPSVNFQVPPQARLFSQSRTFVQSEQERDMYANRGWNPDDFAVTGTSRFDSLAELERPAAKNPQEPLRILYCANTNLKAQTPDSYGYLGYHLYSFRSISMPALKAYASAIKGLPVKTLLKPHNREGARQWREALEAALPESDIDIYQGAEDIHHLFPSHDVMVVSFWSTSILEAMIYGIPTIFIDTRGLAGKMREWQSHGPIWFAADETELANLLRKMCQDKNFLRSSIESPRKDASYYFGPKDGKNTQRIVDIILKESKSNSFKQRMAS